jgi:hypothetical protein
VERECTVTFDARGIVVGLDQAARARFGYGDPALGRLHIRELIVEGFERLYRFADGRRPVELCDVRGVPFEADMKLDLGDDKTVVATIRAAS